MLLTTFLAQVPSGPEFHPAEVMFFKIAGFVTLLLWPAYLFKDLFLSGYKPDPRISEIITGLQNSGIQLAVLANNMQHLTDAQKEQREREKEMWLVINGIRRSLTTIAEDHAHLEGQAAATHGHPSSPPRAR